MFAKVNDFNALIADDTLAQKELHSKLKTQVNSPKELEARAELLRTRKFEKTDTIVYSDDEGSQVTAPTDEKLFKFKREEKQKAANPRKNQHRVAKEVRELGI